MPNRLGRLSLPSLLLVFLFLNPALAWHDKTHLAIAKAAGYVKWYNAAGPDITKIKAGDLEATNHWFDDSAGVEITPEMVLEQAVRYNKANDSEGHLYGAIIQSLRDYIRDKKNGKYGGYHMAFCAHYIGDLSQPLHNAPFDSFNRKHHNTNDGIVEEEALDNIALIRKGMYTISVRSEEDLAREIARIANSTRLLYFKMRKEDRDMTRREAYAQLSKSASLLKAVLGYADRK
jgi:hypothetical protein